MAVASDIVRSLGAYLKAQIINAFIVVLFYIAGFAAVDVPLWLLVGFLCGILNLIPHLGPILALGLGLFAKWFVTDDWVQIAYVGGVWLVIQIVDGFVLSPRAAGRAGVNPFVSILVTLLAGIFLGPLGMLLAVPVLVVISIVVRAARSRPRAAA